MRGDMRCHLRVQSIVFVKRLWMPQITYHHRKFPVCSKANNQDISVNRCNFTIVWVGPFVHCPTQTMVKLQRLTWIRHLVSLSIYNTCLPPFGVPVQSKQSFLPPHTSHASVAIWELGSPLQPSRWVSPTMRMFESSAIPPRSGHVYCREMEKWFYTYKTTKEYKMISADIEKLRAKLL